MPLTVPEYIEIKTAASAPAALLSPEVDGLKDCWIENELNGECTLTFALPATSEKWQYLTDNYYIYASGKEFIILNPDAISVTREGKKVWGVVTAHESWIELGKDYVDSGVSNDPQMPDPPALAVIIVSGGTNLSPGYIYEVGSAAHALYAVLQGTGWTVGTVDVTGIHDLETEKESILANIQQIQETWGGYLVWDSVNKTVSLRDETAWAIYTGYQVRYAKNLKNITRTSDYNIVTKLYPFGKDDLDIGSVNGGVIYLTNNSYTDKVLTEIWVNQDIADPQELKDAAIKYLEGVCRPRHNYTVTQVDRRLQSGFQHEDYDIGHIVDLIDEEANINDTARILRYRYNVFQPWQCELEVGDPLKKIEAQMADTQAVAQFVKDIKTSRNQITGYKLVDESVTKDALAQAAVDATKLNTKTVILLGDVWTDNTPAAGSVSWNQHKLYYNGIEYTITAGNASAKYIYWAGGSTYLSSATTPELSDGQFYIGVNNGGLHDLVWNAPTAREFIGSLFIADAAIKEAHIDELAVTDAKIANVKANKIEVADLYALTAEDGYTKMTGHGVEVFNRDGDRTGMFGNFETLQSEVGTFDRESTAYDSLGNLYAADQPRYEYARFPAPVWQDTFDTDNLDKYTSCGDTQATWAIANGVLSGTHGTNAILIKKDLLTKNSSIVIHSDQAGCGGVVLNYQDDKNYYLVALSDDDGLMPSNIAVSKRVAGTFTLLGSIDIAWTRGTSKKIEFACKGNLLEVVIDDVKLLSVSDSSISGGMAGLWNYSATAFRVLDFAVYQVTKGLLVEEGTTNLVTNPSFESGSTGWILTAAGAIENVAGWNGDWRGRIHTTGEEADHNRIYQQNIPVTSGLTYTLSAMIENISGTADVSLIILWPGWTQTSSYFVPVGKYKQYSVTGVAPATGNASVYLYVNVGYVVDYVFDMVQFEQKAFATSPHDGTRALETFAIDPTNILSFSEGTIECIFTPTAGFLAGNWNRVIGHSTAMNTNELQLFRGSGTTKINFALSNNSSQWAGGFYSAVQSTTDFVTGNSYYIAATWKAGVKFSLYINGVKEDEADLAIDRIPTVAGVLAVGYHPNDSGRYGNSPISQIRISNIARSAEEIQANYNTGLSIGPDEYTTLKLDFDNTLKQTIRKFGMIAKHSITGDYTEITSEGMTRYFAERIYKEIPTGVPNQDTFEGGNLNGWSGVVSTSYAHSGSYSLYFSDSGNRSATKEFEITKQSNISLWLYRPESYTRSIGVMIDDKTYSASVTPTGTWVQWVCSDTFGPGLHRIELNYTASSTSATTYFDDIVFESNPVTYLQVGINKSQYSKEYLHDRLYGIATTYVGEFDTRYPCWVQLPDRFKGKDFSVALSVVEFQSSLFLVELILQLDTIDIVNGRFKVIGYTHGAYDFEDSYGPVTFQYIVIC
ncbi:MAG: hypothetical protein HPY66_1739 [Firmicutes bacterium]|nr:hypothetical protein [Bacillota bacterium]